MYYTQVSVVECLGGYCISGNGHPSKHFDNLFTEEVSVNEWYFDQEHSHWKRKQMEYVHLHVMQTVKSCTQ